MSGNGAAERWRDVPVGAVRRPWSVRFERASSELVVIDGVEHVRVRYLDAIPSSLELGRDAVEVGDFGLIPADEHTGGEDRS